MGNVNGIEAFVLAAALAVSSQQGSQPTPDRPVAASPSTQPAIELPVSLERIQEAISRPPAIKPTSNRPVFRVEIFAPKPSIEDILGPNYLLGPAPALSTSHQEFLNMVTPVEYRGMSMFSNKEAMMIAATSVGLQWALMKAVDKLKEARNERAKDAARREVMEAMNALEAARKKAGLPPR